MKVDRGAIGTDRRALAKLITELESSQTLHHERVSICGDLWQRWKALQKDGKDTRVLGFSGPPGVGKSTFLEKFGLHLCDQGKKVAVLAVDPSSPFVGGSILADKTRMQKLSVHPNAFVRPSPNRSQTGGLHHSTRDVILACRAAGFDEILIETVGAGQSEVDAAFVSDLFISLYMPGTGDSMQAIKKGVLEASDIVVVHKADGELVSVAKQTLAEIKEALHYRVLSESEIEKRVVSASSLEPSGHDHFHGELDATTKLRKKNGLWSKRRQGQHQSWIKSSMELLVKERFLTPAKVNTFLDSNEADTNNPHAVASKFLP
jgi:LAO/AO transport system kinase